ncbi:MAG: ATP-binding protein [Leptospiraceae bacterium]|nr:ATP-binding protein [Leptospiraceae bacterium]
MQPLPIGIQTFRKLREGGYLYIDKTQNIYNLVQHPSGTYFLSRPRRFGKSLLLSTLEEIFLGNKELFKGLWIENADFAWKKHPVVRLDFSKQKAKDTEALIRFIISELNTIAQKYNVHLEEKDYYSQFQELISKLSVQEKVVILIDEYDKPIIDHLENTEKAVEMREVMKGFFTVLKGNDAHIRFLLLTGVSKFSKAGVFSHLNHLEDLTLDNKYSDLLGITQEELTDCFSDYLDEFSKLAKLNRDALLSKIRHWYNGYCFSKYGTPVYNPFSTLLLFSKNDFQYHWFETGTPSFLIKQIIKQNYDIITIPMQVDELAFSSYEVDDLQLTPLLLQTGYLTIKDYNDEFMTYTLDYPNFEVKQAFLNYILKKLETNQVSNTHIFKLIKAFKENDLENAFDYLREIFANIDYDIQIHQEKYYQTIFYLIFTLIGLKIKAEVKTNKGRIDAVIEDQSIYLFEFKLNGTKEEALEQIKSKKYYERYLNQGKLIYLIGAEFKDKNLGEYIVEEWKG